MRTWTIGSDLECDLVVDQQTVSRRHCRLSLTDSGYILEDLGSSNGTFVNGERVNSSCRVTRADRITLGLTALMPWPAEEPSAGQAAVSIPELKFDMRSMSIGRDAGCDKVIDQPMVSARHARLVRRGDEVVIEDLGSSNGTYVNGQRVDHESRVADGDTIGLGSHRLTLRLAPVHVPTIPVVGTKDTASKRIEAQLQDQTTPDAIEAQRSEVLVERILQFQAPLISAAIIVAFRQDRGSMLFWSGLASIWFGLSSMVSGNLLKPGWCREVWFPGGTRALTSRLNHIVVICAIQCLLAWAVIELGGVVESPALPLLGLILLASGVGLAIGLVIISIDPRIKTRWAMVATTIVLFGVLGGGPQTRPWLPPWTGPITSATPTRWAFEGLLLLEANQSKLPSGSDDTPTAPLARRAEYLFPATSDRMGIRADVLALALMGFGYLALAAFISAEPRNR